MMLSDLQLRMVHADDQEEARLLILEGLGEHFGYIDESLNSDINNIKINFSKQGSFFIVAQLNSSIIGTGGLILEEKDTGRIVRISVKQKFRGHGIGKNIVEYLIKLAKEYGYKKIIVSTNLDWVEAIHLYKKCGFYDYDRDNIEVHMYLELS